MGQAINYTYINSAATTAIYGTSITRTILHGIAVNKTLTGTITIKAGTTTIGIIASGSIPGTYWFNTTNGILIESLTLVTSAADDVTVFWSNI
jgi:hypothetical protein